MRLIDADELKEELKDMDIVIVKHNVEDLIDEQPTVDAVPVRYGKWIVTSGGKVCTCPVCGYEFDNTCNYDIRKDWKRCPVCETKMDGE